MAVFPFVLVREKGDAVLLNHERIHLRQQTELLVLPFFVWYGIDFLIQFIRYRDWNKAYRNVVFEREAYAQEKDLDYLKSRKFCAFLDFL